MSMWWLEPGWKQTCCGRCGQNIWDSGGDPDHGICYHCFESDYLREDEMKKTQETKSVWWTEGRDAFADFQREDNPYDFEKDFKKWSEWNDGYNEAGLGQHE